MMLAGGGSGGGGGVGKFSSLTDGKKLQLSEEVSERQRETTKKSEALENIQTNGMLHRGN